MNSFRNGINSAPSESAPPLPLPIVQAKYHPAHAKVPDMPEREFPALLLSVRMHGVLVPVEILSPEDAEKSGEAHHAGMVLDGRQRIRAAKECGHSDVPAVHARLPEGMDAEEYVWRKALERRHLSPGQRALLGVEWKKRFAMGRGFRSDRRQECVPEVGRGQARDLAGRMVGVSGRLITTAEKLLSDAPELAEKVRRGELKLGEAIREHNQAAGKARVHGQVDHALTTFKRFATSLRKVEGGLLADPEAHREALDLLEELERRLEGLIE